MTVTNTGSVTGDEVVFLWKKSSAPAVAWAAKVGQPTPVVPNKELIGFDRVTLAPGASTVVHFNVTAAKLTTVDEFGTRAVLPGVHTLLMSRGHGEVLSLDVAVTVESDRLVISDMVGLFDQTAADLGLE